MNGADSLVKTLLAGGIDVCFTNPGTSEMHFVAALDSNDGMRCILGLHENVVTGAADGYGRMAGRPAATLLHTGPGLANGLSNLHNAGKGGTGIVNIVGDHATYHLQYDAPLTADVAGIAAAVSDWQRSSQASQNVASDGAAAITAARTHPGQIATLILPADTAWGPADGPREATAPPVPAIPDDAAIDAAAEALRRGATTALFLGGPNLHNQSLELAGRIAAKTGVRLWSPMSSARSDRGAGRVAVDRVPYPVDIALDRLSGFSDVVLVGAAEPVAFFAYPDKPSRLLRPDCRVHVLTTPEQDGTAALAMLADAVGATKSEAALTEFVETDLPSGDLDIDKIALAVAALMPDETIVIDESLTSGRHLVRLTAHARPHSWLQICGGSIGIGPPLATGAAVACPQRRVLSLESDGSGMYTLQALWTQARENLDITTVIYSNRAYAILQLEMRGVGVETPGPKARDMMELQRPDLDWVALARGMGVDGARAETAEAFNDLLAASLKRRGPFLIEACL